MSATARPDEQPCVLHDLPWCDVCAKAKVAHRPIPRDHGPAVTARYPGNCACCGERYEEGEQIAMSEADGGWALVEHLEQDSSAPAPTQPEPPRNDVDFSGIW